MVFNIEVILSFIIILLSRADSAELAELFFHMILIAKAIYLAELVFLFCEIVRLRTLILGRTALLFLRFLRGMFKSA